MIRLETSSDPRIEVYRDLPARSAGGDSNCFVCEGRWVVQRLMASEVPVRSVLVREGLEDEFSALAGNRFPVYVLPKRAISEWVGFDFHRGVLACGERPEILSAETLTWESSCGLTLMLDGVCESENLGTILRSCAALGVQRIVLTGKTIDPFRRRVIRVSMAAVLVQRFYRAESGSAWVRGLLRTNDVRVMASCLDAEAPAIHDFVPDGRPVVLIIGSEGHGLDAATKQAATERIRIPMQPGIDSLNVSAAAAILLYELGRPSVENDTKGNPPLSFL